MKRVVYFIVVCLSFQLHRMKRKNQMNSRKVICYLAIMPEDIQNLIVEFLTCDDETDEQFMARIELEKDQEKQLFNYSCSLPYSNFMRLEYYCTDKRKPMILDRYDAKQNEWLCNIDNSDVADEKKKNFTCQMNRPKSFVLSRHEKLCAVVGYKSYDEIPRGWSKYDNDIEYIGKSTCPRYWFSVLHVYNVTTGSKREFGLKECTAAIRHVNFNKQGTQVIVCSAYYKDKGHETFSLKNKDKSAQKTENNSNTPKKTLLEDYLSEKGVCKKLQMIL